MRLAFALDLHEVKTVNLEKVCRWISRIKQT